MSLQEYCDLIYRLLGGSFIGIREDIRKNVAIIADNDRSNTEKQAALKILHDYCHPKWLRDTGVKDMSWQEWNDLLSAFLDKAEDMAKIVSIEV